MAYEYIAFFPNSIEIDLEKLKVNIKPKFDYAFYKEDIRFNISNNDKKPKLEIVFAEFNYKFYITLQNNQEVLQEANFFASACETNFANESYDKDKLLNCYQSLELSADEDGNMDFFNCCIYILEEFEKLNDDIFIFQVG